MVTYILLIFLCKNGMYVQTSYTLIVFLIVRPFRPQIIKVICCSKTGCRPIHDVLNLNDFHLNSQNKWITELNLQVNFGWKFVFNLPFYLTKDSKLQWFQFKIVHRIIGTNNLLSKMELKENDYCSF